MARVSIGKISLTVRYAADAPADAKKKMMHQAIVCEVAVNVPFLNRNAVMISRPPDRMYVSEIIGLRPTVSNSRPSSSGPRKFPAAKGRMYQPTEPDPTP